jgi:hypothetical protein
MIDLCSKAVNPTHDLYKAWISQSRIRYIYFILKDEWMHRDGELDAQSVQNRKSLCCLFYRTNAYYKKES